MSATLIIPNERSKQFGFYQSKPWTSFAPVVVTLDELENHWKDEKLCLPLRSTLNGTLIGAPNAGVECIVVHYSISEY
ncbi:MAG: Fumarylacetoacetate hydrolase family protein [uncultured Aureispira sp.]|uniref:Fumarylacetoacetate hydrolase family protein n=1 Tax=uncultured Aureispira sp. TaxID=1331704 RepID=A0A6S6UKH8_9BACT|nr:MAG: Fumarylacetoacetate hydrolase family protein [uncultured Aureispira sp.]